MRSMRLRRGPQLWPFRGSFSEATVRSKKHAVSRGPKLDPRTDLASIPVLLFCLRIPAQGAERNPLDLPEPNYINTGNCEGCGQKGPFSQLFVGPPGRGLPEPTDFKTTASV